MKLHIACDSTASITLEEAQKWNVDIIPLYVTIDGRDYKDLYEINDDMLCQFLKEGALPKTSQPAIGVVEEYVKKWEKENYEAVIVFTISSHLSGTFANCKLACDTSRIPIYVVDTKSAAGALRYGVLEAMKLSKECRDIQEVIKSINSKIEQCPVYIIPKTLDQLKRGGRISPLAATASSLLKLTPILYFDYDMEKIDKLGVARTMNKAYAMIKENVDGKGISANTHTLALLYVDEKEGVEKMGNYMQEQYPGLEVEYFKIPAVLSSHVGLGAYGIQFIPKNTK